MFNSTFNTAILSTLAAAVVAASMSIEPAFAGGGGGRDATDRVTTSSTQTTKKKKSKYEIYAESIKDVYLSNGMGYYFSKQARMTRLLERLYQEEKAGQNHMKKALEEIKKTGLGKKVYDKKYKPGLAENVLGASKAYNAYKKGRLTKPQYKSVMKSWVGFVP